MNAATISLLLALLAGIAMAVQAPTNAILGKASGSPVIAAFISFLVGTVALGVIIANNAGKLADPALRHVPWYAWVGGLYGAFFVAVAAFAAPRVGVGSFFTAVVAGQLAGALVLDHYGLLGLTRQPITIERIAGVALVLLGAWLVRRG